jgi:hypothetical protein
MTDELPQIFELFERGADTPTFEYQLLTLCKHTPERTWEVLALLDQHHRRGKLSAQLCRTLRHRIQRQVLGIETFEITAAPADNVPAVPPGETMPAEIPALSAPNSSVAAIASVQGVFGVIARSRLRASQALALTAALLGVAASPAVMDLAASPESTAPLVAAADAPHSQTATAEVLSLDSDRYVVYPNTRMLEISVQRTPATAGDTSFIWWTKASGAKPNEDYLAGPPRIAQMHDGEASIKLHVPILANPSRRHIQMFYVLIGKSGDGADVGPIRRAAVFIMPAERAAATIAVAPTATARP